VVRGVLGAEVAAAQPLAEAGLDSLGAVELRGALGARFGAVLPATVAFDYSTPAALAEFLSGASDAPLRGPASGRALGPSHTAEPAALWMLASTKDAVSVCKLSEHAACLRLCMPLHSFVPCPAAYTRNISATGLSMSSLAPQAIAHGICLLACIVMDPSPGAGLALPQEQSSPSAAVPADACEPRSASASSSVGDERRHAHARAAPHPSRARRGSARRQRAPPKGWALCCRASSASAPTPTRWVYSRILTICMHMGCLRGSLQLHFSCSVPLGSLRVLTLCACSFQRVFTYSCLMCACWHAACQHNCLIIMR